MLADKVQHDLFGDPIPVDAQGDGKRKPTQANGYAAPPGTGPAGETCRSCAHYTRRSRGGRAYLKCWLSRYCWTNGPGTDIRASSLACAVWEKRPEGDDVREIPSA